MVHTSEDKPSYRAICFDLDGTLLPMDIDEFMRSYFTRIGAYAAKRGLDPERFMKALKKGTQAMALSSDDRTNKEVFWTEFEDVYGKDQLAGKDAQAIADEFYETEFEHIGDGFQGDPQSARAIEILQAKGYPLVLTTMPMFPLTAIKHRLKWAGIDPSAFERITSYENSKTVKPRQTYYAENLAAMAVCGKDVLMVGNNTMEDLAFCDLAADAYLVTDWLLDPIDFDIASVKHGSFADFVAWAQTLPVCKNPVKHIDQGAIAHAAMIQAFKDNAVREIDEELVEGNAGVLADAIASDHVPGSAGQVRGKVQR